MVVTSALIQATYAGSKQAMIDKHITLTREAAARGSKITCFQEVFFGPYFCQVQDTRWYDFAEPIPGPTVDTFRDLAKELDMVLVVPIYEVVGVGTYYNTTAVIDRDGKILGLYRKTHIPQVKGFWEKFYFKPGNLGYPVFQTDFGKIGVYTCYDRHFPEGARMLGLHGAEIVFIPSATARGWSDHLWFIEQRAHAIANGYFVGTINRIGVEPEFGPQEYYGSSYFCDPRGHILAQAGDKEDEVLVAELDLEAIREIRNAWQFYRDRRPEAYAELAQELP